MSGELEAAGAAITAGLAGGAIERPGKTRRGKHVNTTGLCLNCGTKLEGDFCHACGQPAHISRTLAGLMHEFLNAFMNFDTKAWRTLPRLVGRPGTFTYDYIHGHRARYVSPLATFLFTIFIMFFVFSMTGGPDFLRANINDEMQDEVSLTAPEAQAALTEAQQRRDTLNAELARVQVEADKVRNDGKPGAGGRATGIIAGPRANARVGEAAVKRAEKRLEHAKEREAERAKTLAEASVDLGAAKAEVEKAAPAAAVVVDAAKTAIDTAATAPAAPVPAAAPAPPAAPKGDDNVVGISVKDGTVIGGVNGEETDRPWQEQLREAVESGEIKVNSGSPQIDEKVRATLLNPDLALYKLQETASKFSFLLVPISLPFIALLFLWKRGITFFDHVVFSLYSLSFMSLLFVALAVLAKVGDWTTPIVGAIACLVPPVHIFFHMGGTYKLGWWSALWRTTFLLFFLIFAIIIFALSILALGILG